MKKLLIVAFLFGSAFSVSAQLVLSSTSQIVVADGSTLVVDDIVNTSGTIKNLGTVNISGDVTNNSGGLFDATSVGTVNINGSSAQTISGAGTVHYYGTLVINNTSGDVSVTGAAQEVHGDMTLTSGKLSIGNYDLTLASTTTLTGGSATSYIVTGGTGQLKREVGSSNVAFPVGNNAFNPITLNNTGGTADTYGVKAVEAKPSSFTGTEHIVNESWDVTEASAGNSNLTVTAQWNASDEATNFARASSSIGITTDAGANVEWGGSGAATGSDPYTKNQGGFTSIGTFMVGDYEYAGYEIDLKVVLAAAWNSTTDKMDKTLNTASLIPLSDPYSVGVTVSAIPTDAVDWVKVELRDNTNNATVTNTYAKFVDVDGQIIEADGSNMQLKGVASGSYYVAIHHRNHLSVVSRLTFDLTGTPAVDFTSAQTVAWEKSGVANARMKEVNDSPSTFGLWAGDANDDGVVSYNSGDNDRISILNALGADAGSALSSVYNSNDANMDGNVNYNAGGSDRISILNSLEADPGETYLQHIPE